MFSAIREAAENDHDAATLSARGLEAEFKGFWEIGGLIQTSAIRRSCDEFRASCYFDWEASSLSSIYFYQRFYVPRDEADHRNVEQLLPPMAAELTRTQMLLLTFQDARFLRDADLPLWDDGFPLRVADVSWDQGSAGLLLFLRAREVQRQQLPIDGLERKHVHIRVKWNHWNTGSIGGRGGQCRYEPLLSLMLRTPRPRCRFHVSPRTCAPSLKATHTHTHIQVNGNKGSIHLASSGCDKTKAEQRDYWGEINPNRSVWDSRSAMCVESSSGYPLLLVVTTHRPTDAMDCSLRRDNQPKQPI